MNDTLDYYAEYRRLVALWLDAMDACDHEKQDYEAQYKGRVYRYCYECAQAERRLMRAADTERKAARRRQLAAEPRCMTDGCKRRGTVWTFGTLLCGSHYRHFKRQHERATAGAGILGLLCPAHYSQRDVLEMVG